MTVVYTTASVRDIAPKVETELPHMVKPLKNPSDFRIATFLLQGHLQGHKTGSVNLIAGTWRNDGIEMPALFSYGPHYHLIRFLDPDGKRIALNDTRYSATTSMHRSKAVSALLACGYDTIGEYPMPETMMEMQGERIQYNSMGGDTGRTCTVTERYSVWERKG